MGVPPGLYAHIMILIPPKYSVLSVGFIKGNSAIPLARVGEQKQNFAPGEASRRAEISCQLSGAMRLRFATTSATRSRTAGSAEHGATTRHRKRVLTKPASVSDPAQAALSSSPNEAPGFAGAVLA